MKIIFLIKIWGKSFVFIDLEKECYEGKHLLNNLLVACPMILFYGAIVPGYFMLRLRRVGSARSTDPHLMLRWGMLHSGYRGTKYWWELVVLLRKYLVILLVTLDSKGILQLHMALGVVIVSMHLHDTQRPFGHRHLDPINSVLHRYEMWSLLILLLMLWCAGFFSLNLCQTQNGVCSVMVLVVLVCNFGLVGVLVTMNVKEWWKRHHSKMEKMMEMIKKTRSSSRSGSVVDQKKRSEIKEGNEEAVAVTVNTNPMFSSTKTTTAMNNSRTQRKKDCRV